MYNSTVGTLRGASGHQGLVHTGKAQGLGLLDLLQHSKQVAASECKEQACPLDGPALLKGGHHPLEDHMLKFE